MEPFKRLLDAVSSEACLLVLYAVFFLFFFYNKSVTVFSVMTRWFEKPWLKILVSTCRVFPGAYQEACY